MVATRFAPLLLLTVLTSCYEPKEGCLDVRAVNYDVTADDPCSDCCTYPALKVTFRHQAVWPPNPDTSITFRYDTPYPSPLDKFHYFKVGRFRFLLSGIHLLDSQGNPILLQDSLGFTDPAGNEFFAENNFAKLDRDIIQTRSLGTLIAETQTDQVELTIGLPSSLRHALPSDLPADHPLSTADTLLYDTLQGYRSGFVKLYRDTLPGTPADTLVFFENLELTLPLPAPLQIRPGHHVKLTFTINYLALFDGIDFVGEPTESIKNKLWQNLSSAIDVTNAQLE